MDAVESTVARSRMIVIAMAGGVLALTAVSRFIELESIGFARSAGLPVGLAGLVALPFGWRANVTMRERVPDNLDVETGCTRYTAALLVALAITEGIAFVGIVCYTLGSELIALTGVLTHIMLSGALWPTPERVRPFLERAACDR
jgi:hypothetical protein